MTSVIKYKLDDINKIKNSIEDYTLPNDIKALIDNIFNQINSPGYNKTPVFKTYNKNYNKNYNKKYNQEKNNKNNQDWVEVRNFKSTQLKKSEGDDKVIDNIRKNINKITDKTYVILAEEILNLLKYVEQNSFIKISNTIFNIISQNKFYSNIYAKLYCKLVNKYECFNDILRDNIGTFLVECSKITYCDPEENYDLFCDNNKLNEQRRGLLMFYTNAYKYNIIDKDILFNLIIDIQNVIDEKINLDESKIVDELFELLFIAITNLDKNTDTKYVQIIDFIKDKSKLKIKDYKSFTNKSKFKCYDILDCINKKK